MTTLAINLAVAAEAGGLRTALVALVPLRPGVLDLRALGTTADICALAGARTAVVLNQAPSRAMAFTECVEP